MNRVGWLAIVVAAGLAGGAQRGTAATTWYVAPSGSDGQDGTTWPTAWLTISNALGKAVSNDTILVSNGTYTLSTQLVLTNKVTLQSWKDGALDPLGTVVNGNQADRCLWMNNANALVAGLTFSNGFREDTPAFANGGGGVYIRAGTVSNCLITGNAATNGGGVLINMSGTLRNSTISHNTAHPPTADNTYQGGGGVYLNQGGTVTDCVISNNYIEIGGTDASLFTTHSMGGGIGFYIGGTAIRCVIVNNINTNGNGGGVYFRSGGVLKDSTVANNSARDGGGANIDANGGTVSWCVLERNWARRLGGGVRMVGAPFLNNSVLRNCLIRHNTALCIGAPAIGGYSGGGGVAFEGGNLNNTIDSCTIVSNTAATYGGGLFAYWAYTAKTCSVYNTVCYFNTAATGSNWAHNFASGTMIYSNNCTAPSVSAYGDGNIDQDPRLKDIGGENFALSPFSPCIDAGLTLNWMTNTVDLGGTKRIINERVDMGAYEFFPAGAIFRIR